MALANNWCAQGPVCTLFRPHSAAGPDGVPPTPRGSPRGFIFFYFFFFFLRLTDLAFPSSTRCDPAQERLFISPAIVRFTPGNHGDVDWWMKRGEKDASLPGALS